LIVTQEKKIEKKLQIIF